MDSFLLISLYLTLPPSLLPLSSPHVTLRLIHGGVACAVRVCGPAYVGAENKSSVRYEVIAGIISIVNQGLGAGAEGGVEKRAEEEEEEGESGRRKRDEDYCLQFLKYLETSGM